jgi:PAS domain-containing protein
VTNEKTWDREQLDDMLRYTAIFGAIWIVASVFLAWALARSITSPLAVLHRGTRALMHSPEGEAHFPLPVMVHNEIGELIEAFNRMVASIEEQRAGLSDTLSLLDSMLANAPIGLAFFDRRCRFVRVNRIFAETTGIPLSRHLGRTLPEVLATPVAPSWRRLSRAYSTMTGLSATWKSPVFPLPRRAPRLRRGPGPGSPARIRSTPHSQEVRWVGLIVLDASDRKRSEEALRKTEKLAATGRLAASIAHEINNPLEAITNLLYLLSNHCGPHRAGAQLCGDGRARGAAHLGDHPADPALLPPIHAAGAHQSRRTARFRPEPAPGTPAQSGHSASKRNTTPIRISIASPGNCARSSPT